MRVRSPAYGKRYLVTNAPEIVLKECKSIDFVSLYESDLSFCKMINFINQKNSREELAQIGTLIDGNYVAIDWRTPPSATDLNIIPDYGELDVSQYSNYCGLHREETTSFCVK